jgi:hypothetical protein
VVNTIDFVAIASRARNPTFLFLDRFKAVHEFLISDLPDLDIVLGLDLLSKYELKLQWRKRIMTIADPLDSTAQHASAINDHSSCQPLELNSTLQQARISACTIDCDDSETWLAQLRLTESAYNDVAPLGKGSNNPKTSILMYPKQMLSHLMATVSLKLCHLGYVHVVQHQHYLLRT